MRLNAGNYIIGIKNKGTSLRSAYDENFKTKIEAIKKACSIEFRPEIEWIQIDYKSLDGESIVIEKYYISELYLENTGKIGKELKLISTVILHKKISVKDKIKKFFKIV